MNAGAVDVTRVHLGPRMRKLDRKRVKALADSMAEIGLLNPITVHGYAVADEYELVAGRHRLEAAKLLEWDTIPAVVVDLADLDRRLAEIDENLIRNELSDLERCEHLAQRKRLYLLKHPETAPVNVRGGPGRGKKTVADSATVSFAADTASKTGSSARTVREDVQIAESIPEDVREAIRDTPLAESKTDLMTLARLTEEQQREIAATADLTDKASVRAEIDQRRPCAAPAPQPATTEVEATVEGFARAIASLFDIEGQRRLLALIADGVKRAATSAN